tara:strand:- start:392 stop:724 length:333 start_codon:yes stop_codon:yes gene_type:complete
MKPIKPIIFAPPPPSKESSPSLDKASLGENLFQEGKGRVSRRQIDRHISSSSFIGSKHKNRMKEIVAGLGDANKKSVSKGEVKKGLEKLEKDTTDRTDRGHIRKLRSSLL